jgi:hypothetical protein
VVLAEDRCGSHIETSLATVIDLDLLSRATRRPPFVWRSVTCNVLDAMDMVGPALLRWRGNRRFERIKGNHMAKKRKTKKTKIKCKRAWPLP